MTRQATALDIIGEALAPLAGKLVLDVGCGRGALAAALVRQGAGWVGIDPQAAEAPRAPVIAAGAAALPFGPARFDAVIFLNSLHHIPPAEMAAALREAARVLRRDGRLVVIEPRAEGALFEVMQPVDDETEVRTAAQAALDAGVAGGLLREVAAEDYLRLERYADFDDFTARMLAPDPARAAALDRHRAAIAAAFAARAEPAEGRLLLTQPMRARIFAPA